MIKQEQEELEQMYLLDTIAILVDYDGFRNADNLMQLIDETRVRLAKLYRHEVTPGDLGIAG